MDGVRARRLADAFAWFIVANLLVSVTAGRAASASHLTREELDRYERLRGQTDDDIHRVRFAFEGEEVEACFHNRGSISRVFEINWSIRQYGGHLRVTERREKAVGAGEWACSRLNIYEAVNNSGGYCRPCVYVVHVQALWNFERGAERIGENDVAVRFTGTEWKPTLQFERMYRGWEP